MRAMPLFTGLVGWWPGTGAECGTVVGGVPTPLQVPTLLQVFTLSDLKVLVLYRRLLLARGQNLKKVKPNQ